MSEARIDRITNENNTAGPIISGITTFSGQNFFVPPKGTTAQRPSNCPPGSIRFNTDSAKLEYFDSLQWLEMEAFNVEIGISTNAAGTSGGLGTRGVFGGGYTPTTTNVIDFVTITTLGNAIDFGDLASSVAANSACSSSTRGLFYGGNATPVGNTNITFITLSSTGNTTSFGSLTYGSFRYHSSCSSSTRGLTGGGQGPGYSYRNNIEYVTIASTGSSVDFGDLLGASNGGASLSSSTRGIWTGGYNSPGSEVIGFITISTLGNALNFGNLTVPRYFVSGCSSSTRGVFGGGVYPSPVGTLNTIDYITIASAGNAQDFGDLTVYCYSNASCSSSTRGVWAGGYVPSTPTNANNVIGYINIATTGNAQDFGDLSGSFITRGYFSACSNGHGGL